MKKIKIFLLSILFLGMIIAPNTSSATSTLEELTAMLNSLLSQVAALQQQIIQQTGTTSEWCHTFNTSLKYGDSGENVKNLRIALKKNGFDVSATSGFFDEKIASAVVGFQQKYKSEILAPWGMSYGTGFVGKTTKEKLNQLYGCGSQLTNGKPILTSVSSKGSNPNQIYVGKTVYVEGTGFKANNTIRIGSAIISASSSNGSSLTFTTPFNLSAGTHSFSISNINGTSSERTITVSFIGVS